MTGMRARARGGRQLCATVKHVRRSLPALVCRFFFRMSAQPRRATAEAYEHAACRTCGRRAKGFGASGLSTSDVAENAAARVM